MCAREKQSPRMRTASCAALRTRSRDKSSEESAFDLPESAQGAEDGGAGRGDQPARRFVALLAVHRHHVLFASAHVERHEGGGAGGGHDQRPLAHLLEELGGGQVVYDGRHFHRPRHSHHPRDSGEGGRVGGE